jgi:hypothetical protein
MWRCGLNWTYSGRGSVAGSCEHSSVIKTEKFLTMWTNISLSRGAVLNGIIVFITTNGVLVEFKYTLQTRAVTEDRSTTTSVYSTFPCFLQLPLLPSQPQYRCSRISPSVVDRCKYSWTLPERPPSDSAKNQNFPRTPLCPSLRLLFPSFCDVT